MRLSKARFGFTTAASAAILMLAAGQVAVAQEAPTEDTTVVVTGIKKGIQDSLAVKRKSTSIVEVVSAEDIGKLPDLSIADSLSRLPGLAAQRINGRNQVISIRGFDPDFGNTLFNGRLQVSTGDNRAAEFDQYPAELINRATVYKTSDASIIGQGLSGSVDLETVHPLDYKKRVLAVNIRGSFNSNKNSLGDSSNGNRFSIAYVDQSADGRLGWALGYAHLDDPTSTRHFKYWGWEQSNPNVGWGSAPVNSQTQFDAAHKDAWRVSGFEATNIDRTNVRDGVIGVLEFRPNDNFRSVNDIYYSKFEQHETTHGLMGSLGVWGGIDPEANRPHYLSPGFTKIDGAPASTIGADMMNTSGTVTNILLINRSDFGRRTDEMYAIGSRNTWSMHGWDVLADVSTSSATRNEVSGTESYAGYGTALRAGAANLGSLTFRADPNEDMNFSSSLDFNDPSKLLLGDVAGWGADGHIRYPKVKDRISQIRFEGKRELEFGIVKQADIGIAFSNRTKSKIVDEYDLCLKGTTTVCGSTGVAVPSQYVVHSNFDYLGLGSIAGIDLENGLNSIYSTKPILDENHYDKYWKVEETLVTTFARADLEGNVFTIPFRGNIGVQYVDQTQHSFGNVIKNVDGTVKVLPYDSDLHYGNVLPSLNLNFEVAENTLVRFGMGRSMSRPRMDDLRANAKAGLNTLTTATTSAPGVPAGTVSGTWAGSGGNPNLKPWLADYVDLSLEKYFSKTSYVSLAYYRKDLKNYIYPKSVTFDFTGYPIIPPATGVTPTPYYCDQPRTGGGCDHYAPGNIGVFTQPVNGQGGKADGVELAFNIDGKDVMPALSGFGFSHSRSIRWTDIHPNGPGTTAKLPGFSGSNYNSTLYYDNGTFSARISENWRQGYRGEVTGLFSTRTFTEVADDKQIDAQVAYVFHDGMLNGATLLLQANNLTDSPYRTLNGEFPGGTLKPETYETYGKQILLGISWKM